MALPTKYLDFDLKALDFESKIKAKPEKKPQFTIIYGKGGIGKSTMASYSPDPIIIPVGRETGHEKMCVPKFPSYSEMNLTPINHVYACMQWVLRAEHTRKTLIIDNVGSYRESVDEDVEDSNKGVDLKAYGKGAAFGYPYWTRLLAGIDAVMKRRDMHVILLGHDGSYNVNNPDGSYYQKISINAPRGENTNVMGLLEARAHNVLYVRGEDQIIADKRGIVNKDGPVKKYATSGATRRVVYTKPRGDFFAKSRVNMEEYYEIEQSETEEELLHKRTNPTLIQLFTDLYK
jgi:hypothetical protein